MSFLWIFVFFMLISHYYFIYQGNKIRNPETKSFRPRKKKEEDWNKYDYIGFSLTIVSLVLVIIMIIR